MPASSSSRRAALVWSAAVLTGGRSSRMGRDKALVEVDGVAMAVGVARVLEATGASEVRAVGGDLAALGAAGVRAEPDPRQGEGPLGGIVSALELLAPGSDAVLVVACDLPWLDVPTVEAVVGGLASAPEAVASCAWTDRREPLCTAWRASALGPLRHAFDGGTRGVHRAWNGLTVVEVPVDRAALRDVDHPDDLPPGST